MNQKGRVPGSRRDRPQFLHLLLRRRQEQGNRLFILTMKKQRSKQITSQIRQVNIWISGKFQSLWMNKSCLALWTILLCYPRLFSYLCCWETEHTFSAFSGFQRPKNVVDPRLPQRRRIQTIDLCLSQRQVIWNQCKDNANTNYWPMSFTTAQSDLESV